MKKLIETLFATKVVANVKNINGRKSAGTEDYDGYNNWRDPDRVEKKKKGLLGVLDSLTSFGGDRESIN